MATGDLATLAQAREWVGILEDAQTGDDVLLQRLITGWSRFILNYLQRGPTLLPHTVTERRTGPGGNRLMLIEYPVTSVQSVVILNQAIPPQPTTDAVAFGYVFDPWDLSDACSHQCITVLGTRFYTTPLSTTLVYIAGYQATDLDTVPGTPFQLTTQRPWGSNVSVAYANGTPLTQVASGPVQAQYSVSPAGVYTFSAADDGQSISLIYGYIPNDLQQACLELVGEAFRRKDRIGQMSKSLGGNETISFSQKMFNDTIGVSLQLYRNVVPL